jgi:protein-histidine pros-kinase
VTGAVRFIVEDTGIGIKADAHARLFSEFSQVDPELSRAGQGTGLGLHLSQKLAQLLGGRIACTSEYGAGSTFELELKER